MSLLDPKFWLAIVIWTAAVGGAAYFAGNTTGKNSVMVDTLTAENKALKNRAKENQELTEKYAQLAQKASDDHAKELETIRATAKRDAGKRVPISAGFCRPAGTTESAAPGSDGQTDAGAAFLPEQFAGDLRQLAAYADEVTADLRTLKRRAEEAGCFQ
jgi:hypothetical protein